VKKYRELALWYALKEEARVRDRTDPYLSPGLEGWENVLKKLDLDEEQAYFYLHKWADEGLWDSGVTPRTGWFTPKAEDMEITRHGGFVEK